MLDWSILMSPIRITSASTWSLNRVTNPSIYGSRSGLKKYGPLMMAVKIQYKPSGTRLELAQQCSRYGTNSRIVKEVLANGAGNILVMLLGNWLRSGNNY
ncbi:hypothetical protein FCV25MIE_04612 [Fagus crenata]